MLILLGWNTPNNSVERAHSTAGCGSPPAVQEPPHEDPLRFGLDSGQDPIFQGRRLPVRATLPETQPGDVYSCLGGPLG